ncbi:MAG: glycoside hydrolase family 3 N-terminal domain-containing protein [Angelakisella sp.]
MALIWTLPRWRILIPDLEHIIIGPRAFGSDAQTVSSMVNAMIDGLHDGGVMACIKHFPGHGAASRVTATMAMWSWIKAGKNCSNASSFPLLARWRKLTW